MFSRQKFLPEHVISQQAKISYRATRRLPVYILMFSMLTLGSYFMTNTQLSLDQLMGQLEFSDELSDRTETLSRQLASMKSQLQGLVQNEEDSWTVDEIKNELISITTQLSELNQSEQGLFEDQSKLSEWIESVEQHLDRIMSTLNGDFHLPADKGPASLSQAELASELTNLRNEIIQLNLSKKAAHELVSASIKETNQSNLLALAAIMFATCALVALSLALSRLFFRQSIESLTSRAEQIGDGDYSSQINFDGDAEFGLLGQAMEKMAERIKKQNAIVEESLSEAEHSAKVKSEFLANMSHEIRTPMTAILGYTDLLAEAVEGVEERAAIETIQRNARGLLVIIDDILNLSKLEAGQVKMESIEVDLLELMEDSLSLFKAKAAEASIELKSNIEQAIPRSIKSDPTRIKQIINNLMSNALKFTKVGSVSLGFSYCRELQQLVISVEDTGAGMSEEGLSKIFRPFTQADNSTTRTHGGTGLGLTISKNFAELLGGSLTASSIEGEGSRFTLRVHVGEIVENAQLYSDFEELRKLHIERTKPVPPDEAGKILEGKTVLLIEDGKDNQLLISAILKKVGAKVSLAENGAVGVAMALAQHNAEEAFDLIVSDMQMPIMDGYEAARRLRKAGIKTPIIALTANAMEGDKDKCITAGCSAFCSKPINRKKFLSTLAKECQLELVY